MFTKEQIQTGITNYLGYEPDWQNDLTIEESSGYWYLLSWFIDDKPEPTIKQIVENS